MRVAITGGTGFVGRHLAHDLVTKGHEAVLIARGKDRRDESIYRLRGASFFAADLSNPQELIKAFAGCEAVAHCAGINREIGAQTYQRVHIEATKNVVHAARAAGVWKIVLLSFLRARPDCGSAYHESKWAAEEIVRASELDYTVFKAGVIYGRGDHMLDHLSHALHTFPVFGLVGMKDKPVRPLAVVDLVKAIEASLSDARLSRKTVSITGPEEITLREAVLRVADAIGRHPLLVRLPIALQRIVAWLAERTMNIPLLSLAQLRILSEGLAEALPACDALPEDLLPATRFETEQIRRGLPEPGPFGLRDLRCART
jgi:nucleoside-diphosphate-sugar epimerase